MKIRAIRVGRTYPLPDYNSVHIEFAASVDPDENIEQALDLLLKGARLFEIDRFEKRLKSDLQLRQLLEALVYVKKTGQVENLLPDPGVPTAAAPGSQPALKRLTDSRQEPVNITSFRQVSEDELLDGPDAPEPEFVDDIPPDME